MNPEENKHRNMVWCLLRRNISTGQLAGYAVATFVGLAILSVALQFIVMSSPCGTMRTSCSVKTT